MTRHGITGLERVKGWMFGSGQRLQKLLIINVVDSITKEHGGEFPETLDDLG
jgi:hypothetical protein